MKDGKEFDCVQMKWDIQQRLLHEFQGMKPEESRRSQREKIADDPLLGSLLEQVALRSSPSVEPSRH